MLPASAHNLESRSHPLSHSGLGLRNAKESVLGLEIKSVSHALGEHAFQKCFASLNNGQQLYMSLFRYHRISVKSVAYSASSRSKT